MDILVTINAVWTLIIRERNFRILLKVLWSVCTAKEHTFQGNVGQNVLVAENIGILVDVGKNKSWEVDIKWLFIQIEY